MVPVWQLLGNLQQGSDATSTMSSYRLVEAFAPELPTEVGPHTTSTTLMERFSSLCPGEECPWSPARIFSLAGPCYIKEAQACPDYPLPIAKPCYCIKWERRRFRKGTGRWNARDLAYTIWHNKAKVFTAMYKNGSDVGGVVVKFSSLRKWKEKAVLAKIY